MQVHPAVFYGFQVVAIAAILIVAGTAAYFFLNTGADDVAVDAKRQAEILQLSTRAGTYFARLQYYQGVCSAIGADATHRCHESDTAYAVETRLTDGSYYCADSTGFRGAVLGSKGDATLCAQ